MNRNQFVIIKCGSLIGSSKSLTINDDNDGVLN